MVKFHYNTAGKELRLYFYVYLYIQKANIHRGVDSFARKRKSTI